MAGVVGKQSSLTFWHHFGELVFRNYFALGGRCRHFLPLKFTACMGDPSAAPPRGETGRHICTHTQARVCMPYPAGEGSPFRGRKGTLRSEASSSLCVCVTCCYHQKYPKDCMPMLQAPGRVFSQCIALVPLCPQLSTLPCWLHHSFSHLLFFNTSFSSK